MENYQEFTSLLNPERKKVTKSQFIMTVAPFMLLQASVGLCASLQATFYPIEAEKKGATPSQFGAVFGIIHVSLFTFGPIVGKYLSIYGVKMIYPSGFIVNGLAFVFFGLLEWVENVTWFLVLSYLIRMLEGVGAAATWNSNLSILMAKFPERKASVKAWCDASFNLGLTLGPVIGAFMYDAGGFCLPFSVTGTLIIMSGFLVCSVTEMPILERSENSLPVLQFLTKPAICGALFTATVAAYTIGTIEATLSIYLGNMTSFSVKMIAMAFLTMSLSSVLATPVSGWMCDTKMSPWLVSIMGCFIIFICFMFLGPAPYIFCVLNSPNMLSVCISLICQGVGSAAVLVASFSCAQLAAVAAGLPDASDTQAVIAGLFTSSFAAGNFLGPTISGVLYEVVGFSHNSLIIQCILLLVILLNFVFYTLRNKKTGQQMPDVVPQE